MPSMKCIECGIGFFSADGGNKCSKCRPSQPQGTEGHVDAAVAGITAKSSFYPNHVTFLVTTNFMKFSFDTR